jgi:hypothetical protein
VRLEGSGPLKYSMTSSEIEPATFGPVACVVQQKCKNKEPLCPLLFTVPPPWNTMVGRVKRPQREAENSVLSSAYCHFVFPILQSNSGQASDEITRPLWNLKIHKIQSLVTSLKQINSVHTIPSYLCKFIPRSIPTS